MYHVKDFYSEHVIIQQMYLNTYLSRYNKKKTVVSLLHSLIVSKNIKKMYFTFKITILLH